MPQIRNVSGESRDVPALGRTVDDGEVLTVPAGEVYAYTQQSLWEPADGDAQAEHDHEARVTEAVQDITDPATPTAQPAGNALRDVWVAYARLAGATDDELTELTRDQIRDTYGKGH